MSIYIYIHIERERELGRTTRIATHHLLKDRNEVSNTCSKSAGFAGMSSEVGLGDGLLVCTAFLLLWSKLELIMSMGRALTSPKNTPPSTTCIYEGTLYL